MNLLESEAFLFVRKRSVVMMVGRAEELATHCERRPPTGMKAQKPVRAATVPS